MLFSRVDDNFISAGVSFSPYFLAPGKKVWFKVELAHKTFKLRKEKFEKDFQNKFSFKRWNYGRRKE